MTFGQCVQSRRNNLDFLRFFFASLVILSHSFPLIMGDNTREPLFRLTAGGLTLGSLAVAGFFAISGFLITQSWQRSRRPADYWRKRLLRIYPGWTVALLVCLLVVAPVSRASDHLYLRDRSTLVFLSQLALHDNGVGLTLPGVFAHNPLAGMPDGATWTIPFELICYLLVAGVGAAGLLRRPALVLAGTVLFALWVTIPPHPYWANTGPAPSIMLRYLGNMSVLPLFAVYFLSGACFYLFRDRVPASRPLAWVCGLLLVAAMAWTGHHGGHRLLFLLLPTAGSYALFSVAFAPTLRLQDFGDHRDLSYGVYLYGWPVQGLLVQYAGRHLSPVTLFLLAWPLACVCAALSWRFVERPFLRLKPKPQEQPAAVPEDGELHETTPIFTPAP